MKRAKIKKNDQVMIIAGRDKGKRGRVLEITPVKGKVKIEGAGIIKLEMRTRCATLMPSAQQAVLGRLAMPQIVALRFASDAELPALLDRADREQLSSDQIKKAIKNWTPDWDRT